VPAPATFVSLGRLPNLGFQLAETVLLSVAPRWIAQQQALGLPHMHIGGINRYSAAFLSSSSAALSGLKKAVRPVRAHRLNLHLRARSDEPLDEPERSVGDLAPAAVDHQRVPAVG